MFDCQLRSNVEQFLPGWFLGGCRNTSLCSGGCVVINSSCVEGAGASAAVGQASTVHGVAGPRMECACRCPRNRCVPVCGDELDTGLQDLPQRRRGRVRPPLDRLEVREISTRYLFQDERIEIADLRRSGLSLRATADRLGRAPSTISRELRRNAPAGRGYQPFDAHRRATARRARHHRRRVDTNEQLSSAVTELLAQRWSPQQTSRHLRLRFPDDPTMRLCPESIYQAVYQPNSRFMRPSRLAPHRRSPLRTGRDHR